MKAYYTISITTVVLLVAFATIGSALEPKLNLRRAVHPESGAA